MSDAALAPDAPASPQSKPKNIAEALKTKREPPPEDASKVRTRRWVILSFWFIVLLFGLPTWWITTTVYRANLPLQQMTEWSEGKVGMPDSLEMWYSTGLTSLPQSCSPVHPLRITIEAPDLSSSETLDLQQTAQHSLDDLHDFAAHHIRLTPVDHVAGSEPNDSEAAGQSVIVKPVREAAMTVQLNAKTGLSNPTSQLQAHSNTLQVSYSPNMLPSSGSSPSVIGQHIASEVQQIFSEEQALLAALHGAASKHLTPEVAANFAKRTTRSVKYAPAYHLSFSLFTPEDTPSGWEINEALQRTFAPLLKALSLISRFTIDTQVQPYALLPASVQPVYNEAIKGWTLNEKDLGGFINTAEWPLSPGIGIGPTVNFVLYVPSAKQSPLYINGSSDNSWLVPQWGGVVLHNSPDLLTGQVASTLSAEEIAPAALTFSSQLMSLLGVPETPTRSLPMRLSTMKRVQAARLFFSASSTMGSLARLVQTLPSISIPDSVADNVASTLQHLDLACNNFREGAFDEALRNGKVAEAHAEKAFFEKSMVGQVYFPDEHKVAVYLPLLGPVAVPLLVAAIRELRAMLRRKSKVKVS